METRWRWRTTRDSEGSQRFWDNVDIMPARGTDERTGRRRKCGLLLGWKFWKNIYRCRCALEDNKDDRNRADKARKESAENGGG